MKIVSTTHEPFFFMQRLTLLFIFFIVLSSVLIAQRPGGMPQGSADVRGRIIDQISGDPIEYANVALFRMKDSVMVTGASTNKRGEFTIVSVPYGRYRLVADFIGFERYEQNALAVTPREDFVLVPDIRLRQKSIQLEGTEITADRATYQYKIDKKVVSVDADINSAGGTAADVLENTPSVEVDIEGNVSLRGSSNFTVLVNGRPSILEGTEALQQISAAQIKEIEIITNPSAKYDPEGTAGIINVITKKQEDRGINGVANVSIGTGDKYRADILLNYRTPKYNLYGTFDYRDDNYEGKRTSYREVTNDGTTYYLDGTGTRAMSRGGTGGKLGMDYFLTSRTTLGGYLNLGTFNFSRGRTTQYKEWTSEDADLLYYLADTKMPRDRDYYGFNLNFQHKFGEKNHQLDAMIDYAKRDGGGDESSVEWLNSGDFSRSGEPYYQTSAREDANSTDWTLKLDYVRPLWSGKMEAGWQSQLDEEREDYAYEEYDPILGWIDNSLFSSAMDYSRHIHSIYSTYGNEYGKFGYQLGVRGELTQRYITDEEANEEYKLDRIDWFPSIHLSQQLDKGYQVQASYTRRINRPRGWYLEPFRNYIDKDNQREGNPALEPEYVDSYELSLMKKWGMSFVSVETFYRSTENLITRILVPLEGGIVLHTFDNLNRDHSLGGEVMLNYEVNSWLNFNLSASVYNYRLEGLVDNQQVDRESTNWRSRLNTNIKFTRQTRLQLNGGYSGPSVTAQGESKGMLFTSAALRHDFKGNKFSAIAQIRDIFGTARHDFTAISPGFYENTTMEREAQVVQLTLTYRINDYKPRRERENGGDGNGEGGYEY